MSKHTPTPWEVEKDELNTVTKIGGITADGYAGAYWLDVSDEDAAHIVKCVNEHEALQEQVAELVEALSGSRF